MSLIQKLANNEMINQLPRNLEYLYSLSMIKIFLIKNDLNVEKTIQHI